MYFNEHNDPLVIFVHALVIFFFVYLFFGLFKDHCCVSRSTSHHHIRSRTMVFFVPTNPSHTASHGLDPAVVNSLPVVTFSSSSDDDDDDESLSDCSVCLSEFEEGELTRVLHGCKHAFHVECIDMWFHSHSTCPLCRSLVEFPATTVEEQVVITISPEPVVVSSSAGAPSQSEPSSSCGIVMTESDIERGGEEMK